LNEDEEMIRDGVRRFFDAECSPDRVRGIEDGGARTDPELWRQLAELGWLGLALPSVYGGGEAPFTQLTVLFEEAGRALAPVPLHPHVVTALALAEAVGRGECGPLAATLVSEACVGDSLLTWAWSERLPGMGPETIELSATADGNGWRLNGHKGMVEAFEIAGHCLVAARTQTGGSANGGLTLLLVAPNAPGVSAVARRTLAGDFQSEVHFDNVYVDGDGLVGRVDEGWDLARPMLQRAMVLNCAMIVGATRRAAERAFDYAKERHAFGHPIGSFQAIQHTCADMITWVDGAELLTREAAWHIAQGSDAGLAAAAAKAFTNERCQAVLREANQIHGGYAQVREYDQQLWYRRAAAWSMRLGTSMEHRRAVAQALEL
ncbi:MAG: acyl-CoA/acyl-ACP dehydrogenase, partial [Rhodospirillaceae bacterium]|nr:acyl-CoA/acyl-ACP dehydrogenase [Rhodospirillaceae bacterium]